MATVFSSYASESAAASERLRDEFARLTGTEAERIGELYESGLVSDLERAAVRPGSMVDEGTRLTIVVPPDDDVAVARFRPDTASGVWYHFRTSRIW